MIITKHFSSFKSPSLFTILILLSIFPSAMLKAQCALPSAVYAVDVTENGNGTCTFKVQLDYSNPSGGGNSSLSVNIETFSGIVLLNDDCLGGLSGSGSITFGPYTNVDCSEEIIVNWRGRTNPFCGGGSCGIGSMNTPPLSSVLPVELIDFRIEERAEKIALYWTTASEERNAYFAIEHSSNARDFFEIGVVEGYGTTDNEQHYTFLHDAPLGGNNYYRLRQVDVGEQYFEYSETIVVELEKPLKRILVYPTSTSSNVQIDFSEYIEEPVEISLVALNGEVLHREIFSGGKNGYAVDLSPWPAGLYYLRLYFTESNKVSTRKVVKVTG